MVLFEFVVGEWIFRWRQNTNPGYQVKPIFLQADQPIRLQYSHQIKLFWNGKTNDIEAKQNGTWVGIPTSYIMT